VEVLGPVSLQGRVKALLEKGMIAAMGDMKPK
jgi:hypothetical protein